MKLMSLVFSVVSIASAGPVLVFSDFGPGDTYHAPPGVTVGCGAVCWGDAGHTDGFSFTVPTTPAPLSLSTVEIVARQWIMGPSTLVLSIDTDSFGLPSVPIESFSALLPSTPQILSFSSLDHPLLQPGGTYWLVVGTQDPVNQAADLPLSIVVVPGLDVTRIGTGPWSSLGNTNIPITFRITADVPEPLTPWLIGTGICLVGLLRRVGTI